MALLTVTKNSWTAADLPSLMFYNVSGNNPIDLSLEATGHLRFSSSINDECYLAFHDMPVGKMKSVTVNFTDNVITAPNTRKFSIGAFGSDTHLPATTDATKITDGSAVGLGISASNTVIYTHSLGMKDATNKIVSPDDNRFNNSKRVITESADVYGTGITAGINEYTIKVERATDSLYKLRDGAGNLKSNFVMSNSWDAPRQFEIPVFHFLSGDSGQIVIKSITWEYEVADDGYEGDSWTAMPSIKSWGQNGTKPTDLTAELSGTGLRFRTATGNRFLVAMDFLDSIHTDGTTFPNLEFDFTPLVDTAGGHELSMGFMFSDKDPKADATAAMSYTVANINDNGSRIVDSSGIIYGTAGTFNYSAGQSYSRVGDIDDSYRTDFADLFPFKAGKTYSARLEFKEIVKGVIHLNFLVNNHLITTLATNVIHFSGKYLIPVLAILNVDVKITRIRYKYQTINPFTQIVSDVINWNGSAYQENFTTIPMDPAAPMKMVYTSGANMGYDNTGGGEGFVIYKPQQPAETVMTLRGSINYSVTPSIKGVAMLTDNGYILVTRYNGAATQHITVELYKMTGGRPMKVLTFNPTLPAYASPISNMGVMYRFQDDGKVVIKVDRLEVSQVAFTSDPITLPSDFSHKGAMIAHLISANAHGTLTYPSMIRGKPYIYPATVPFANPETTFEKDKFTNLKDFTDQNGSTTDTYSSFSFYDGKLNIGVPASGGGTYKYLSIPTIANLEWKAMQIKIKYGFTATTLGSSGVFAAFGMHNDTAAFGAVLRSDFASDDARGLLTFVRTTFDKTTQQFANVFVGSSNTALNPKNYNKLLDVANTEYTLTVIRSGGKFKCYVNGALIHTSDVPVAGQGNPIFTDTANYTPYFAFKGENAFEITEIAFNDAVPAPPEPPAHTLFFEHGNFGNDTTTNVVDVLKDANTWKFGCSAERRIYARLDKDPIVGAKEFSATVKIADYINSADQDNIFFGMGFCDASTFWRLGFHTEKWKSAELADYHSINNSTHEIGATSAGAIAGHVVDNMMYFQSGTTYKIVVDIKDNGDYKFYVDGVLRQHGNVGPLIAAEVKPWIAVGSSTVEISDISWAPPVVETLNRTYDGDLTKLYVWKEAITRYTATGDHQDGLLAQIRDNGFNGHNAYLHNTDGQLTYARFTSAPYNNIPQFDFEFKFLQVTSGDNKFNFNIGLMNNTDAIYFHHNALEPQGHWNVDHETVRQSDLTLGLSSTVIPSTMVTDLTISAGADYTFRLVIDENRLGTLTVNNTTVLTATIPDTIDISKMQPMIAFGTETFQTTTFRSKYSAKELSSYSGRDSDIDMLETFDSRTPYGLLEANLVGMTGDSNSSGYAAISWDAVNAKALISANGITNAHSAITLYPLNHPNYGWHGVVGFDITTDFEYGTAGNGSHAFGYYFNVPGSKESLIIQHVTHASSPAEWTAAYTDSSNTIHDISGTVPATAPTNGQKYKVRVVRSNTQDTQFDFYVDETLVHTWTVPELSGKRLMLNYYLNNMDIGISRIELTANSTAEVFPNTNNSNVISFNNATDYNKFNHYKESSTSGSSSIDDNSKMMHINASTGFVLETVLNASSGKTGDVIFETDVMFTTATANNPHPFLGAVSSVNDIKGLLILRADTTKFNTSTPRSGVWVAQNNGGIGSATDAVGIPATASTTQERDCHQRKVYHLTLERTGNSWLITVDGMYVGRYLETDVTLHDLLPMIGNKNSDAFFDNVKVSIFKDPEHVVLFMILKDGQQTAITADALKALLGI